MVTDRKFSSKRKFLDRFFLELPFEFVYTPKSLDLDEFPKVRDSKDSPILATAIMESVDVFLTGDKDFFGSGCRNTGNPYNGRIFRKILKYKLPQPYFALTVSYVWLLFFEEKYRCQNILNKCKR